MNLTIFWCFDCDKHLTYVQKDMYFSCCSSASQFTATPNTNEPPKKTIYEWFEHGFKSVAVADDVFYFCKTNGRDYLFSLISLQNAIVEEKAEFGCSKESTF